MQIRFFFFLQTLPFIYLSVSFIISFLQLDVFVQSASLLMDIVNVIRAIYYSDYRDIIRRRGGLGEVEFISIIYLIAQKDIKFKFNI